MIPYVVEAYSILIQTPRVVRMRGQLSLVKVFVRLSASPKLTVHAPHKVSVSVGRNDWKTLDS